jgi:hypothetical protein
MKNIYDLYIKDDRKELFYGYLINSLPHLKFEEFESNIAYLCNIGLANQWLNVVAITIGGQVCPNRLITETSMVYSIGITDLLTLARELMVFDDQTVGRYVKRWNTSSFSKLSVLSEIKIASSYLKNGYLIEVEPSNRKTGKSGLICKSDLRVNFNGEWLYFEITKEGTNL